MTRRVLALAFWVLPLMLVAQGTPPGQRIRALAARGDSAGARRLADSLARSAAAGTEDAADGLYWRGALTRSRDSARSDLSRVVVDHPGSPVAGDALYRLALMDLAENDRASARRRLLRVDRDYGTSASAGNAAAELGSMLMTDGASREGCVALDSALARIPAEQVEKRNRLTYLRRPCALIEAEAPRDTAPSGAGRGAADTAATAAMTPPARGGRPAPATRGRQWSVQVGAFATRADAEEVAKRLTARGYEARVTPERPFRVRIGRFSGRPAAAALVAKLKAEKTTAIIVEAERP